MNRFDTLCKKIELKNAIEARDNYGFHCVRTDLSESDVQFLAGSYRAQLERIEYAKRMIEEWWA